MASFAGARLNGANLTGAKLEAAVLRVANLSLALLDGAKQPCQRIGSPRSLGA